MSISVSAKDLDLAQFQMTTEDQQIFKEWPSQGVTVEPSSIKAKRNRCKMPALPERLFCALVPLPGKSLAVYLVLKLRAQFDQSPTVTLTTTFLKRFGISRREKATALQALEDAGFITVVQRSRKNPLVTLCAALSSKHVRGDTG
jgi:hypothetical protein